MLISRWCMLRRPCCNQKNHSLSAWFFCAPDHAWGPTLPPRGEPGGSPPNLPGPSLGAVPEPPGTARKNFKWAPGKAFQTLKKNSQNALKRGFGEDFALKKRAPSFEKTAPPALKSAARRPNSQFGAGVGGGQGVRGARGCPSSLVHHGGPERRGP